MTEEDKNTLFKFVLIYFFVFGILSVTHGWLKACNSFYHQVIIKDQVVGQPIKNKYETSNP